MLRFKKDLQGTAKETRVNLLPCHIHHEGSVSDSERYWKPQKTKDGNLESYFRGRKLKGKELQLPSGHEGVIVEDGGKTNMRIEGGCEGEEEGEVMEVGVLKEVGSFDGVVLWDHEKLVEADDPYAKGLEEWIAFADKIHHYPDHEEASTV